MTTLHGGWGGSADRDGGLEVVCVPTEPAMVRAIRLPPPSLDYYLIRSRRPDGESSTEPAGIVVEEFVLDENFSAVRLDSTGWTPGDRRWRDSSAVSRGMRVDAAARSHVGPISRQDAETIYRRLGGGELPDEETLRSYFGAGEPLATAAPLRLGLGQVATGFRDTRVYRILFANELTTDRLAHLEAAWGMRITDGSVHPHTRVAGTASRRLGDDVFTWELRRIGAGVAWCIDLTANLASSCGDAIGPLMRELTTVMRCQGLIPVTIERFS
ncbi:hypothetical protein ACFP2T_45000 [Plantactinospora solaniradicis]|uniref:Uncharacterized protein n=1 Tax=Plantactinospora solaniradicis TaxID=1723736 RepID=A0ABW1KPD2_9ACTN